ncbi:hypothetical protein ACS0TY_005662 [Phlomoides rotata]
MKILSHHHGIFQLSLLLLLLSPAISSVAAQPPPTREEYPNYAKFSPSMAIIIVVLISALFFMGFISIYIRHCSGSSGPAGSIRRALSLRSRRSAAARGLDASVLETFPIFSYSEVKDHQIGKGELECAVCLNDFQENETLRLIPKCNHVFHPECIDAWLESHVTCPVCRANLAQIGDEPAPVPELMGNDNVEESSEIAIDVDESQPESTMNRSSSLNYPNQPPRAWSIRRPKMFGKFRSHSTGHSLVQPGRDLERYTLRLPDGVRKEVIYRAVLRRTGSVAATLPTEGSSRKGYRTGGGGEGRFYRGANSDRWMFFSRGLSMKSPKVADEGGETSGGGGGAPVKLPSFRCLEPKTADETGLISGDACKNPV